MGTDIEVYAEVFDGERWRPAEPLVENEGYDPEDEPLEPRFRPQSLYRIRNRDLFAILTEGIAPPRGLPPDVSPEVAAFERPRHDDGLFRHGWLTLEELLAFRWEGPIAQRTGMIDPDLAPLFDDNPLGFPFARWPPGRSTLCGSWHEGGVVVRWRENNATLAGPDFMERVLPRLKSFGPASSVRIVFWFKG